MSEYQNTTAGTPAEHEEAPAAGARAAAAQPRQVLIVCHSIDEAGGVQRWARSMGELLASRGHHVHLVGVIGVERPHDYEAEHAGPLPYRTSLLHNMPLRAVPRPAIDVRLGRPLAVLRHRRWLRTKAQGAARLGAIIAELPQSAVIICVQVFAMEWVTLANTHGVPVIGMSHESYAASMASTRGRRVKQYYANLPRFVALTEQDARDWTTKGHLNNAAAMPNPLPFPARGGADPASHTCIALGRLSQEKGFDLLLEAWAAAMRARPGTDWKLRVYGDGSDRTALEEQAVRLGIEGSVTFEGPTSHVAEVMRQGSLFLSSSRAEGFPMTLLEALAGGLPCLAFDCAPGVREILRGDALVAQAGANAPAYGLTENGALVAPGNTEAYAAQLGALLDDEALRARLAKRAADSVARYAPEVIAERWERMFALVHR